MTPKETRQRRAFAGRLPAESNSVNPGRGHDVPPARFYPDASSPLQSRGILVERLRAWRQLNPRVPAALVDGKSRHRKLRVSKRAYGDAHGLIATLFGVEDGAPANWAKPEYEPGSLIPDTDVFGGGTEDFERSREACQCREDTAGPLLAGEAVANADSTRFAFDLNTQLSAGARGCSGRH